METETRNIEKMVMLEDLSTANEYLDLFMSFFIEVIRNHHYDSVKSHREADAHILFQMFFSKTMHFQHMLQGASFQTSNVAINRIIDPTLLFTLVRNQYECLCLFELINIIPNSESKKDFLSLIHQVSGLKYRQRFADNTTLEESIQKVELEKKEIEEDTERILSSSVYHHLDAKSQNLVRMSLKSKDYQLYFKSENEIQKLGWRNFADKFGMKNGGIDNLYTYFCLHAHPSYPSIMQFRDAFAKSKPEFINMAIFASQTFLIFLSVFLVDYMRLFPSIVEEFKKLDADTQKLLIAYNDFFREDKYKATF